jgi:DNA-binding transcriptional LysR family regulator
MNKKRLMEHLEKLNTFKAVAELKSVHKASARLGLSQPAVSRTIKVLESVLECRLMERESRGIKLTEDGLRLFDCANLIAKSIENFDPTGELQKVASTPLRIATYDNIACNILSGLSKNLIIDVPRLSISVSGTNMQMLGDLISGKFDVVFVAQPRVLAGLEYKKIFKERYGLFVSKDFYKKSDLGQKKTLRVEDIKKFQLIAMPDAIAGTNKNIDRLLWELGLKSPIVIDSYEVAMQLTRDGVGIGIMPFSTAWRDLCEGGLIELHLKDVPRASLECHDLTICWKSKQKHPNISSFEKALVNFFFDVTRKALSQK